MNRIFFLLVALPLALQTACKKDVSLTLAVNGDSTHSEMAVDKYEDLVIEWNLAHSNAGDTCNLFTSFNGLKLYENLVPQGRREIHSPDYGSSTNHRVRVECTHFNEEANTTEYYDLEKTLIVGIPAITSFTVNGYTGDSSPSPGGLPIDAIPRYGDLTISVTGVNLEGVNCYLNGNFSPLNSYPGILITPGQPFVVDPEFGSGDTDAIVRLECSDSDGQYLNLGPSFTRLRILDVTTTITSFTVNGQTSSSSPFPGAPPVYVAVPRYGALTISMTGTNLEEADCYVNGLTQFNPSYLGAPIASGQSIVVYPQFYNWDNYATAYLQCFRDGEFVDIGNIFVQLQITN